MGFLAPWYLLVAGAALVPLLIHLLRRRIGLQVEFPAARYLARAEREHSRTLRLRNLLLMLLRVLAVVLLALAAARPTTRSAGAGHAPTALAIVLDNSMSTGVVENGTPLLEQLKTVARGAVAQASTEDRAWLVTADGAVRGGSPAAVRDEIDRVKALGGAGRLTDALARAIGVVEASGMDARQVAVLTDGQRTSWTRAVDVRGDAHVLVWAPSRAAPANRALALVEARPVRWTPRGAVAVRTMSADSTSFRIALGARTLARGTAAAGEEAMIHAAPAERGWMAGSVEIEPDELTADNTRHFALWIGAAPSVRVAPSAGEFARNAVDVLRSSQRVVEGSGIVVAAADEAGTIPALLMAPADPVRIGAANRALERLGIPWRFGTARRENGVVRGTGDQMRGVSVALRYDLVARGAASAETLAVVGRDPWIVSGPRYVLVGSPLTADASTLPVSASFLPWLGDVLSSRLHGEPGVVRVATPLQTVARPPGVDALESTQGARTPVSGNAFEAPGVPGTYFLIEGSRRAGALVVNSEVAESQLERWPAAELGRRVSSPAARVAKTTDDWRRLAFSGASRRSLAVPLLVAALLVIAAELVVSTGGARGIGTSASGPLQTSS
ncbi:MAG TPA: BatA and WFA domain-containing protein [Gemmatimonadaceae bacterium]|nr:BatA and WFA domain-containing protein [Gemmatimonadaceae bacterium]